MIRKQAKRVAGAIALLLAVYLAALVFLFPASIAWRVVEARLDLPITVVADSVTGRIWSGRANGVRVDGHDVGAVDWRLMPASLLRGRLGLMLDWQSGGDRVDARVRLGIRSAEATDVRGGLDAARIQAWGALPLLLDGRLELELPRIHWSADGGFTDADGTLLWSAAGAGLPRPIRLGEYRAELSAAEGALAASIDSGADSPLAAEGTASWHPAGEYRVDLRLLPGADADSNLVAAIDSIAQRQADGSLRLQFVGR
jgi:general secretion pathway protein N